MHSCNKSKMEVDGVGMSYLQFFMKHHKYFFQPLMSLQVTLLIESNRKTQQDKVSYYLKKK